MNFRQARAHARIDFETGAIHAQRLENILGEIVAELHAADGLDHFAGEIDVDTVVPLLAGIGDQWCGERRVLAGDDAGNFIDGFVFAQIGVPQAVTEARRMGEQMAQRDGAFWCTQTRRVAVPAVQHFNFAERRNDFACRGIKRELALLDQLHRRQAGDRFGHGRDPHHRVRRHGDAGTEHRRAERAFVNHFFAIGRNGNDTGNIARTGARTKQGIRARLQCRGVDF